MAVRRAGRALPEVDGVIRRENAERRWGCLPTKVLSVDLREPLRDVVDLGDHVFALVLARIDDEPIGTVRVPVHGDRVPARVLADAVVAELSDALLRARLLALLEAPVSGRRLDLDALAELAAPVGAIAPEVIDQPRPTITVAVCTRDRPDLLDRCLASLRGLRDTPRVLVVDNAPTTDATARLMVESYPEFAYVVEPVRGLDHARNRAIAETTTEVVAFTDDDVVVDPGWTEAIARAFAEDPQLAAVTGLVVPFELETPAQQLFERLGGFGRGYRRRWETATRSTGRPAAPGRALGAGEYGTGANMAFRAAAFARIGGFDPALDVGTPTGGGGDLEMFHRVISSGEALRYEPAATVFHCHRRTMAELCAQLRDNGSVWAMMTAARRGGRARPSDVRAVARWYVGRAWPERLLQAALIPNRIPLGLPLAEIRGLAAHVIGDSYARSQAVNPGGPVPPIPTMTAAGPSSVDVDESVEMRTIDLDGPITMGALADGTSMVSVLVTRSGAAIGRVEIATDGRAVSDRILREVIVDEIGVGVLGECATRGRREVEREAFVRLATALRRGRAVEVPRAFSASVVVATLDRPDSLAQCLQSLGRMRTRHCVEIVVVDNNPSSGLTAPVLDKFPEVVHVTETRRGAAYARNAGILAAKGDIVVTTDDDVQVPPAWLDLLLQPFERNDVMAVCGNVQPLEVASESQRDFERTGALGKGFVRFESRWENQRSAWRAFPAWEMGATANAAFRSVIFSDPEIGLMDEALGPGMPTGVGEDSYLVYKIVCAGFTVVYEPAAYVNHQHRDNEDALTKQLRAYYSGHVAHNVTSLVRDHDPRGLMRLARVGAYVALARARSATGRGPVSPLMARAQVHGAVRGPLNYVRAQQRVKHEGRSVPPAAAVVRPDGESGARWYPAAQ